MTRIRNYNREHFLKTLREFADYIDTNPQHADFNVDVEYGRLYHHNRYYGIRLKSRNFNTHIRRLEIYLVDDGNTVCIECNGENGTNCYGIPLYRKEPFRPSFGEMLEKYLISWVGDCWNINLGYDISKELMYEEFYRFIAEVEMLSIGYYAGKGCFELKD